MYQDYLDDIIKHYRAGEKNGNLPQRLIQPTPGSIKEECVSVCEAGLQNEDLRTLTAFFKADKDNHAVLRAIHRCDRDRFRPLVNFLKGITSNTDDLNIELLAWLIDFPGRPFRAEKYPGTTVETANKLIPEKNETGGSKREDTEGDKRDGGIHKTADQRLTRTRKIKSRLVKLTSFANTRQKLAPVVIGVLLLVLFGFYLADRKAPAGIVDSKPLKTGDSLATSVIFPGGNPGIVYVRCTGSSPCRACSNCSTCNWCNSGGSCGICAITKKTSTQKRAVQCQATTKKGKQCSRAAKEGNKYCWQHGR